MLVITIIVIIILAVAVILTLSNNNPIENAKHAVEANDEATMKEAATLAYSDWYMKKNIDGEDVGDAESYVKEQLKDQGFSAELINKLTVTNEGKITIVSTSPVIPNGFVASEAEGENDVSTGLVIYEGTEPVTDDNVATARMTRNQFVWVPVKTGTFVREDGYGYGSLQTYVSDNNVIEPYSENGYTEEVEEYNEMVNSVNKYGGFYIARYEASNNGNDEAQIVSNQKAWDIVWSNNEDVDSITLTTIEGGAVEAARAVYPASSTTIGSAVSTLVYGVQWDATVRFLEKNYPEISQDSTGYGNYGIYNEETEEYTYDESYYTGNNTAYALNNIYDMAGNLCEWTMEVIHDVDDSFYRAVRGGMAGDYNGGNEEPISYREGWLHDSSYGLRIALYIK